MTKGGKLFVVFRIRGHREQHEQIKYELLAAGGKHELCFVKQVACVHDRHLRDMVVTLSKSYFHKPLVAKELWGSKYLLLDKTQAGMVDVKLRKIAIFFIQDFAHGDIIFSPGYDSHEYPFVVINQKRENGFVLKLVNIQTRGLIQSHDYQSPYRGLDLCAVGCCIVPIVRIGPITAPGRGGNTCFVVSPFESF